MSRVSGYHKAFKEELSHFFNSDLERIFGYLDKHSGIKMRAGDAVFYFHNPDNPNSELKFGVLTEIIGSDVIVEYKNNRTKLSKQRIFLYAPSFG